MHLATGLRGGLSAKTSGRFITAANLVNELFEARQQDAVRRVHARWMRVRCHPPG
jgi:hypothetical protein